MTLSKRQDAVLQYLSANRKRVLVEALLKATGIRYATFLCILLVLQACQPGTDTATHSAGTSTEGVPTLQLMAPRILLDTRAVDTASLGVEVEVSYIVSGTNYQESGLAARSGSVWELDIAVPRNTPFEIRMTWFENGETRLDLARITRSSDGFSDSGRLSFSQDFSSADSFSDSPGADDYDGFNDDEDSLTNLEELINGTDPLDSSDPSLGGPLVEDPPTLDLQTTTLLLATAAGTEVSGFLTVANAGGQSLDYSIESDSDWLTVSPAGGQIAGGTSENLQVSASCGSTEEPRSGTLTFTTNGGNDTVSVELTCQPLPPGPPVLNIATTQLPLTASAENTASDVLTLENTGDQSLDYSIESDSDWLSISPAGGQIAGAASQDVQVSGNCGSTSETRSGTLTVTTNGGNGTVAVQLTCSVGPVIELPPSLSVNLNASINETASDTITLGNLGDAELSFSLSSDAAWLAVSPQQGAIAAGETVEIGVSGACGADATELSNTLSLVGNGGNAEFTISLSCTGGPVLSDVSPASIQLAAEVSQAAQGSLSFTNSGSDVLGYTVQTSESWLCLSQNDEQFCATGATTLSGQLAAGATTTVSVLATCSEAPQTLTGLIELISNGSNNTDIPVTLNCEQSASPSGLIVNASVDESTGTFISGTPPVAVGEITLRPFDEETLDTIISGGSIELPVDADQPFSRLYVVTEPDGYFDILLPEPVENASLILTANTELDDVTEASITVQAETPVGLVSEGEMVTVSTLEVLTGDLQISVSWDQATDVDLHLITPSEERIWWNVTVVGNGRLDLDSNRLCRPGPRNENISFGESDAPPGQYVVALQYYDACGLVTPTQYVVTVRANGITETYTGSFIPSDIRDPISNSRSLRTITTIEVR